MPLILQFKFKIQIKEIAKNYLMNICSIKKLVEFHIISVIPKCKQKTLKTNFILNYLNI